MITSKQNEGRRGEISSPSYWRFVSLRTHNNQLVFINILDIVFYQLFVIDYLLLGSIYPTPKIEIRYPIEKYKNPFERLRSFCSFGNMAISVIIYLFRFRKSNTFIKLSSIIYFSVSDLGSSFRC